MNINSPGLIQNLVIMTLTGVLFSTTVTAQTLDGGNDPTLVADPTVLSSNGFPENSTNVYTDESGQFFTIDSASTLPQLKSGFGNESLGYSTVQPADLMPRDESQQYDLQGGALVSSPTGSIMTCPIGETEGEFMAPVHLPQGVLIKSLEIRGLDNDNNDHVQARLKKVCQTLTAGVPNIPVITSLTANIGTTVGGTPGLFTAMQMDIDDTVDNKFCHYHLALDLEGNGCQGSTINFHKARIAWQRQIKSGPGAATFTDVPTNHPFYDAIEAMSSSAITGGCGGGFYCPDAPLTRGQMAAFLARALGLHFPGCDSC